MSKPQFDNKFCLPIIRNSKTDVARLIKDNLTKYRFFEIWIDYISEPSAEWLSSLITKYPNRLVIIFRRQSLEPMTLSPEQRIEIMKTLSKKAVLFDLDITVQEEEITHINKERLRLKTILSYHNYSFTPSDSELHLITEQMLSGNAYISKIATFCKTQRDSLRLLSLLIDLRESGQRGIVLGMGPHGAITRIFGTLWGNEMTFAPRDPAEASAPGQFTLDELQSVLGVIS